MALAIDASSPAAVVNNAGLAALTTASFSPPANSLIVVIASADDNTTPCSASISDNQSNVYSLRARSNANGTAEVWTYYTPTALTGLTVTATFTNAWNFTNSGLLQVLVFTGAQSTQPGAATTAIGATSTTITPQTTGSYMVGVYTATDVGSNSSAYDSNTTLLQSVNSSGGGFTLTAFRSTATTPSLNSAIYGLATNLATQEDFALVEILATPIFAAAPYFRA